MPVRTNDCICLLQLFAAARSRVFCVLPLQLQLQVLPVSVRLCASLLFVLSVSFVSSSVPLCRYLPATPTPLLRRFAVADGDKQKRRLPKQQRQAEAQTNQTSIDGQSTETERRSHRSREPKQQRQRQTEQQRQRQGEQLDRQNRRHTQQTEGDTKRGKSQIHIKDKCNYI